MSLALPRLCMLQRCSLSSIYHPSLDRDVAASPSPTAISRPCRFQRVGRMDEPLAYNTKLRSDIKTHAGDKPKARVHSREWEKIMNGDPVEINPSVGFGYKVMTVDEWSARWKRNDDFPECLKCGSSNTKEHHFTQTWCRAKKKWESETLCLDCHGYSWREYCDPDFKTPEDYEKERWTALVAPKAAVAAS